MSEANDDVGTRRLTIKKYILYYTDSIKKIKIRKRLFNKCEENIMIHNLLVAEITHKLNVCILNLPGTTATQFKFRFRSNDK